MILRVQWFNTGLNLGPKGVLCIPAYPVSSQRGCQRELRGAGRRVGGPGQGKMCVNRARPKGSPTCPMTLSGGDAQLQLYGVLSSIKGRVFKGWTGRLLPS
jgi:hypothetical protein